MGKRKKYKIIIISAAKYAYRCQTSKEDLRNYRYTLFKPIRCNSKVI